MGDPVPRANPTMVAEGRAYAARAMRAGAKLACAVLEGVTEEDMKADMANNQKDAPLRAHFVVKLMSAQMRADMERTQAGTGNSLNVTIIQQASDNKQWLDMAKPFQLAEKQAKAIDVVTAEKVPVAK